MALTHDSKKLKSDWLLSYYASLKHGSLICQRKESLSKVAGLKTTKTVPDSISFDDSLESRAIMPCGHVLGSESMVNVLLT